MPENTIALSRWEDFDAQVETLRERSSRRWLFRGLADSAWPLTTTLERQVSRLLDELPDLTLFVEYYRLIDRFRPHAEVFSGKAWNDIETFRDILNIAQDYSKVQSLLEDGDFQALGYLAFLRQHGFPSPLLDWTRSPYTAAFFAFRESVRPASGMVAIYAYCKDPDESTWSAPGRPEVFVLGPHVRTHRRHFLQQGQYTMCLQWTPLARSPAHGTWRFVAHDSQFQRSEDNPRTQASQDLLWKIELPWDERVKALERLDEHNVNALSLFESNEALLETLTTRRWTFGQID